MAIADGERFGGATTAPSALEASRIRFAADGRDILNGIDITLTPGERLGVIGPNGSGKSTLLRCLYAWHQPSTGAVMLDGRPLAEVTARERARKVAVLAQESATGLGLTVEEVVGLGRLPHRSGWGGATDADREEVDKALAAVGLSNWRERPFGPLSGGEKQRVLFARALAQNPSLLFLDEPTNHLDIRHQLEVLDVARRLSISVVTTLHDLNIAGRWCDRLCLVVAGRVAAIGTPEEVLTPEIVSSAYGVAVDCDTEPRTGSPRLTFHLA